MAQAQAQQQLSETVKDEKPTNFEDASKLLKLKIEPAQKSHIKSQLVDDVLEILIKNGELPPSAAQDPATPTTPGRQVQSGLVLSAAADSASQSHLIFAAASPMEVSQSACPSPSPIPPPPPLPLATFSIQLPCVLHEEQQQQHMHHQIGSHHRQDQLLSSPAELESAIMLSPSSMHQQNSPDPQPPQEVTSSDNANLDLKDLGLDLESFDSMDFGQLDCDIGVKMEHPHEFMDIAEVPMEMDDSDWLDSFMRQSPQTSTVVTTTCGASTNTTSLSSHHNQQQQQQHTHVPSSNSELYDPLFSNSQDPYDLFSMEDNDLKMSSDLTLSWDKVDFAT